MVLYTYSKFEHMLLCTCFAVIDNLIILYSILCKARKNSTRHCLLVLKYINIYIKNIKAIEYNKSTIRRCKLGYRKIQTKRLRYEVCSLKKKRARYVMQIKKCKQNFKAMKNKLDGDIDIIRKLNEICKTDNKCLYDEYLNAVDQLNEQEEAKSDFLGTCFLNVFNITKQGREMRARLFDSD